MKAQLFYGPKDIRYEEIGIPEVGEGEALVKVRSALTCGSDVKTYMRGHPTMIKKSSVFFSNLFNCSFQAVGFTPQL